jgi:hypothetical protein
VLAAKAEYNRQGWHDAAGHYYRYCGSRCGSRRKGAVIRTHPEVLVDTASARHRAVLPRANHGDLVELTRSTHSARSRRPFDLGQLPVECGCTSTW